MHVVASLSQAFFYQYVKLSTIAMCLNPLCDIKLCFLKSCHNLCLHAHGSIKQVAEEPSYLTTQRANG